MTIKIKFLLFALCSILTMLSCKQKQEEDVKMPPNTFTIKGSVREMNIWPEPTSFPEHDGKAEFVSYCGICHSLKYISSQPDFPRKTWDAEVHKMIVKYNAPIDSVTGKKIVDYLVAIKSKS
jgi:hypothetical protein